MVNSAKKATQGGEEKKAEEETVTADKEGSALLYNVRNF